LIPRAATGPDGDAPCAVPADAVEFAPLEAPVKMSTRFLPLFACALFVLAGCGAAREAARRAVEPAMSAAPAPADELQAPAEKSEASGAAAGGSDGAANTALALPQARMVIKTAELSLLVRDVEAAFTRAVQLTEGGGGYVQTSTRSAEGGDSAELTLKVPPQQFLSLIDQLDRLGVEERKSIGGQDVTEEYYDLDAELSNKVQVRARLFQLLAKAAKVPDAIQVEEQLERVGADINRIKGRMKYLTTMVGLSTITLSIHSEARATVEEFINWSLIGHGFVVAARVLVRALFFLLQALVVLIPLAAIAGGVTWAVFAIRRRRRPAKKGRS
jgi:hypothetical protein